MDRESSPSLSLPLSSPRVTQGSQQFKITGCSLSKGIGIGKKIALGTFMVGGYAWAMFFYPDGKSVENNASYVSLFIALASEGTDVRALFELTLLDQSGKERHKVYNHFWRRLETGPYTLKHRGCMWGYYRFFKRTRLEKSDYLKDDCLSIHCSVGVVTSHTEGPKIYPIPTPPSDIGQHFGQLLENGKGTQVNFEVDVENFAAHKLALSDRSPVFKAMRTQCIKIEDVEGPVFKESGLMYLDHCEGLCGQYDLDKDSLRSAVSEIKEVIEVLCETFDIVFGQTWMLCKHCNSLSTINRCATELGASYQSIIDAIFLESGSYCILRDSKGVIGRAARSSHNLVYCENVAKFSTTEYPFAHFVRKYHLSASFAICLQSNHSGDQVYVLEFFLGPSYVNWGLRVKLVPILDKMRQSFQTFKVAYGGEEIGDNLFVLVVDALSPDKVETLKNEPIDLTLAIGVKNVETFYLPYYSGESSRKETDDWMIGVETSLQDISMDDVPVASASTVQSEILVTVKANYRDDFVRFQLPASSGIHELYRQVSQRLELTDETYDLSYRDDDNDLILLRCDEDLQFYISSSTKQGNYTLLVSIKPKCASPMLFP